MALFSSYKKNAILKASIKQVAKARSDEGHRADQLFLSAYKGFSDVIQDNLMTANALYNWGFGLLHQAKSKGEDDGVKLYLEAIAKFNFCLLVKPDFLGAAIDGGVAYMDLAQIMSALPDDELYDLAKEFFDKAETIQKGSAAYNLACIYSVRHEESECVAALELAKTYGSLPELEEIVADPDLKNIHKSKWFTNFIESITAESAEQNDASDEVFDEEGNPVKSHKNQKDLRKNPEFINDGVVYDVEGKVVRKLDKSSKENRADKKAIEPEVHQIKQPETKTAEVTIVKEKQSNPVD